jgi:hypothetical protein
MVQELIANHFKRADGEIQHSNENENKLSLEMLKMTSYLVSFGFYNTISALKNLCDPLVATLDGRNDNAIHKEETTQGIQKRNSLATVDASNYTHMIARR